MPTTLANKTLETDTLESLAEVASSKPKRDAKWYSDQDPTLYPEAVAHILTPKRRRTIVTTETFDAIRAACVQD